MEKMEFKVSETLLLHLLEGKEAVVPDFFEKHPLHITLSNNINLETIQIAVQKAEMSRAGDRARINKNLV